ncbi:hypothetical protein [Actinoplanes sp. NPDC051411]|uniref:hypothetical protein n=1 Tax=Actinoplanes sp. NPDC051411 TaxID=3155522 RepID=UPI003432F2FD
MEALTPSGRRWHTYLHPEVAARDGAPRLTETPDVVLRAALDWSGRAGLTAAVRDVLTAHGSLAKDTFAELVGALGVPRD